MIRPPPKSTLFPYPPLFRPPPIPDEAAALLREPYERSGRSFRADVHAWRGAFDASPFEPPREEKLPGETTRSAEDRKSTRLNSSHGYISYAVFCLKKQKHKS